MHSINALAAEESLTNSVSNDTGEVIQARPRRYHELDSMRGLASLTVFFSHFVMGNMVTGPICEILRMSPAHIIWDGSSAVLFFFVLSGFVLALPYINNQGRYLDLLSFYLKRIFRIYPAFIIGILISVALKEYMYDPHNSIQHYSGWLNSFWKWNLNDNLTQLKYTLMLLASFNSDLFDPVIWSLAIEMNISFIIPFLTLIIKKNELLFNILFITILTYVGVEFWMTIFYAGILLARYHTLLGSYINKASKPVITGLFIITPALYTFRFTFHSNDSSHYPEYISCLASCIFIMLALYNNGFSAFLKNKICVFLGKVSYSFYLIHLPILITVASVFPYKNDYSLVPVFFISLSSSLFLAYIMYKFIETPFQNFAHKIVLKYSFWQKIKFR